MLGGISRVRGLGAHDGGHHGDPGLAAEPEPAVRAHRLQHVLLPDANTQRLGIVHRPAAGEQQLEQFAAVDRLPPRAQKAGPGNFRKAGNVGIMPPTARRSCLKRWSAGGSAPVPAVSAGPMPDAMDAEAMRHYLRTCTDPEAPRADFTFYRNQARDAADNKAQLASGFRLSIPVLAIDGGRTDASGRPARLWH